MRGIGVSGWARRLWTHRAREYRDDGLYYAILFMMDGLETGYDKEGVFGITSLCFIFPSIFVWLFFLLYFLCPILCSTRRDGAAMTSKVSMELFKVLMNPRFTFLARTAILRVTDVITRKEA